MSTTPDIFITADWPAPSNVHAVTTTRIGGSSFAPYASFNLAEHVEDDAIAVTENRARLRELLLLPSDPVWLTQVHGNRMIDAADQNADRRADASMSNTPGIVCSVMTADCLPVLLCNTAGTRVAAAHAGWRGLLAGVIEQTIEAMQTDNDELMVWLGPAIGPQSYEVGAEVRETFLLINQASEAAFKPTGESKWLMDIYALARLRLGDMGITNIHGGDLCTYSDAERFYSYRRDGVTGRMASLIWMSE